MTKRLVISSGFWAFHPDADGRFIPVGDVRPMSPCSALRHRLPRELAQ
jgi:hypothetical protein